jgi:hypothetical protein
VPGLAGYVLQDQQMAAMKLYMTPGSCSTGIHIILEELEQVFEAYIVNLPAGDHFKPDYVAINPKSTIPTLLRRDGTALTEVQAIAYWCAPRGAAFSRQRLYAPRSGATGLRLSSGLTARSMQDWLTRPSKCGSQN